MSAGGINSVLRKKIPIFGSRRSKLDHLTVCTVYNTQSCAAWFNILLETPIETAGETLPTRDRHLLTTSCSPLSTRRESHATAQHRSKYTIHMYTSQDCRLSHYIGTVKKKTLSAPLFPFRLQLLDTVWIFTIIQWSIQRFYSNQRDLPWQSTRIDFCTQLMSINYGCEIVKTREKVGEPRRGDISAIR